MIVEGIVTTLDADGGLNVSPMGPLAAPDLSALTFRPYRASRTYANLVRHRQGVFHVVDDALLLAQAAVSRISPPARPAARVEGFVLLSACRAYEFEVAQVDDSAARSVITTRIVHVERLRDFIGFQRARHAVVEAAILATRTAFLPREEILRQFESLQVLVDKTGDAPEHEALRLLREHVERAPPAEGAGE